MFKGNWTRAPKTKFNQPDLKMKSDNNVPNQSSQNWVRLVWKSLVDHVGVFCPLLGPPSAHITKHQKHILIYDFYNLPNVFLTLPLKDIYRERMKSATSVRIG